MCIAAESTVLAIPLTSPVLPVAMLTTVVVSEVFDRIGDLSAALVDWSCWVVVRTSELVKPHVVLPFGFIIELGD